jgi:cell division cycle 20-like protein 1 (cofactor of APC complex)
MDNQGIYEKSIPLSLAPPSSYNVLRFSPTKNLAERQPLSLDPFSVHPYGGFEEEDLLTAPYKQQRNIPKVPFKVLDAPALADDFYLNLVDWSSANILAVGLQSSVYLWSATSNKVTKLYDLGQNDLVTSVSWSNSGAHLAVGTNTGNLQIWDTTKCKMIKTLPGHEGRVGSVAWNSKFLSTGSRDKSILHRDLRSKNNYEAKLTCHK